MIAEPLPVIRAHVSGYGGVVMSNGPWDDSQAETVRRLCEASADQHRLLLDLLPVLARGEFGGPGGSRCPTLGPLCDRVREVVGRVHS